MSGADMLSLLGAEGPDGEGSRWAHFLTCSVSLVEFGCSCWSCVMLRVRMHVLGPCGRSGDVRVRHAITFRSRGTGWRSAEAGTVSDLFRLLGRIWVFLLVLCHATCPYACFEPLWSVRGDQTSRYIIVQTQTVRSGITTPAINLPRTHHTSITKAQ